ncbi:MAG TPA: hypothetical protein VGJ21_08100 [Terracidiphilus sp.]
MALLVRQPGQTVATVVIPSWSPRGAAARASHRGLDGLAGTCDVAGSGGIVQAAVGDGDRTGVAPSALPMASPVLGSDALQRCPQVGSSFAFWEAARSIDLYVWVNPRKRTWQAFRPAGARRLNEACDLHGISPNSDEANGSRVGDSGLSS